MFQEDVKQVLDWLQNHGEVFLRKNVGIGRNLAKARAYQKSHQTFEGVVQNTYTNAEKLLAAAAELAQVLTSLFYFYFPQKSTSPSVVTSNLYETTFFGLLFLFA